MNDTGKYITDWTNGHPPVLRYETVNAVYGTQNINEVWYNKPHNNQNPGENNLD